MTPAAPQSKGRGPPKIVTFGSVLDVVENFLDRLDPVVAAAGQHRHRLRILQKLPEVKSVREAFLLKRELGVK